MRARHGRVRPRRPRSSLRSGWNATCRCFAAATSGRAALPLSSRVRQGWDLASLDADYRRFIRRFRSVVELLHAKAAPDPGQCFVVRTLLIHEFRRVTLHDPQLPAQMLPASWHAHDAYALCRDFYRLNYRWAEQHLAATLEVDGGPLPPAAPYFYAAIRRPDGELIPVACAAAAGRPGAA